VAAAEPGLVEVGSDPVDTSLPVGPSLNGPEVAFVGNSAISKEGGQEEVLIVKKGQKYVKKPKKGGLVLGSARCMNLKDMASNESKLDGKRKKNKGKGVEVDQRISEEVNFQAMVSGVQAFFEEDGSGVPETPKELMGYLHRKRTDAEHLLKVDKEDGITFTMADGTVVDRLVVLEDVDVENRENRERREGF
jgi:hypothetical protein